MIKEDEVRDAVISYLENQNLDGLEVWLAGHSWDMHLDSDFPSQGLVSKIQMALAEYNNGNRSGAEVRRELLSAIENQTLEVAINAPSRRLVYSTSSRSASLGM